MYICIYPAWEPLGFWLVIVCLSWHLVNVRPLIFSRSLRLLFLIFFCNSDCIISIYLASYSLIISSVLSLTSKFLISPIGVLSVSEYLFFFFYHNNFNWHFDSYNRKVIRWRKLANKYFCKTVYLNYKKHILNKIIIFLMWSKLFFYLPLSDFFYSSFKCIYF